MTILSNFLTVVGSMFVGVSFFAIWLWWIDPRSEQEKDRMDNIRMIEEEYGE